MCLWSVSLPGCVALDKFLDVPKRQSRRLANSFSESLRGST